MDPEPEISPKTPNEVTLFTAIKPRTDIPDPQASLSRADRVFPNSIGLVIDVHSLDTTHALAESVTETYPLN